MKISKSYIRFLLFIIFIVSAICLIFPLNFSSVRGYVSDTDNNFYNGSQDDKPLSELEKMTTQQIMALPEYDSTDYGLVTGVENQTGRNTCWSFGTASATATSILREKLTDIDSDHFRISADNIAYTTFNRIPSNDVLGNTDYDIMSSPWNNGYHVENASERLMQWNGPLVIDVNDSSFGAEYYERPEFILENYEIIPGDHRDSIKRAIATHGAVAASYDTYMGDYVYYNSNGVRDTEAHAITIIGWNDNLSPDLFYDPVIGSEKPSIPGGWLVKNSWGVGFHYYGYFFISYESYLYNAVAFDYAKNSPDRYNYYYDGIVTNSVFTENGQKVANIFRTKKASDTKREFLDSVNVGVQGENITIDVKIYKDVVANFGNRYSTINNPESGTLVASGTRKVSYSGDYTIDLDKKTELLPDQNFSIVVTVSDDNNTSSLTFSREINSSDDMSFYYDNGRWQNTYTINNSVARIKAFTHTEDKTPDNSNDIKNASTRLTESRFVIGKSTFTPKVNVIYNEKELNLYEDYNVEYVFHNDETDFVNELNGYYEIIITGRGNYTGQKTEYYRVLLSRVPDISAVGRYDGWESGIEIFVDNTVNNFNEVLLPEDWEFVTPDGQLNMGDNTNTLRYKGKYKDYFIATEFQAYIVKQNILKEDISSEDFRLVNMDKNRLYRCMGVPVTPDIQLYYKGSPLIYNEDYGIEFINNESVGKATCIAYGKGNFKGRKTLDFDIGETPQLKELKNIVLSENNFVYDGQKKLPVITVYDKDNNVIDSINYTINYSKDLINAGTVTITINGKNGYTGQLVSSFTISKADNEITELKIENGNVISSAKYGTVNIKYYSDIDCLTEIDKPDKNGTYYIKAFVEETNNYNKAEKIIEFVIDNADPTPTPPIPDPDPDPTPDPTPTPEPEPQPEKKGGCFGNLDGGIVISIILLSIVAIIKFIKKSYYR